MKRETLKTILTKLRKEIKKVKRDIMVASVVNNRDFSIASYKKKRRLRNLRDRIVARLENTQIKA